MPVKPDPEYAAAVAPQFGEFLGTYESDHRQARASLFRKGSALKAYLSYEKGLEPDQISDRYLTELQEFARGHGLELQLLHVVH